jgi:hypothetical protein
MSSTISRDDNYDDDDSGIGTDSGTYTTATTDSPTTPRSQLRFQDATDATPAPRSQHRSATPHTSAGPTLHDFAFDRDCVSSIKNLFGEGNINERRKTVQQILLDLGMDYNTDISELI